MQFDLIPEGVTLQFNYCKNPLDKPTRDAAGRFVQRFTPRNGVVERSLGWGVVLREQDPTQPVGVTRFRSYNVYDRTKVRRLVLVS